MTGISKNEYSIETCDFTVSAEEIFAMLPLWSSQGKIPRTPMMLCSASFTCHLASSSLSRHCWSERCIYIYIKLYIMYTSIHIITSVMLKTWYLRNKSRWMDGWLSTNMGNSPQFWPWLYTHMRWMDVHDCTCTCEGSVENPQYFIWYPKSIPNMLAFLKRELLSCGRGTNEPHDSPPKRPSTSSSRATNRSYLGGHNLGPGHHCLPRAHHHLC